MVVKETKYEFPHKQRMYEAKYLTPRDCCSPASLLDGAHGDQVVRRPPAAARHRLTFINVAGEDIYLQITDSTAQPPHLPRYLAFATPSFNSQHEYFNTFTQLILPHNSYSKFKGQNQN